MLSRLKDTLLSVGGAAERAALRSIFERDYDLLEAENVPQAMMLLQQNRHCIAAVLMDGPLTDGEDLRKLSALCHGDDRSTSLPLLFFVGGCDEEKEIREERAFACGADDVVRKPFTANSIRRRLEVLTDLYLHRTQLERVAAEQSETIRKSNQVMLDALSAIIEHRSTESGKHVLRIRAFTRVLLEEVAANYPEFGLTEETIAIIASASALHDIGKISIPDAILNKPGKLTAEEFEVMKTHTTVGSELVQQLEGIGDDEYLRYAYNIALYHHERWDGRGYPLGLIGDAIPLCAQVVGIADAYDALTTPRAYKDAFSCVTAVNMILNGECGAFSPGLCECFKRVRHQFSQLAIKYADGHSPQNDNITAPLPTPVWKGGALNSAQLTQVKYQTLMHYTGDTVVEFNMDDNVFHAVYNPDPDIEPLLKNSTLQQGIERLIHAGIHPDDKDKGEALRSFTGPFFDTELRRLSVDVRLYSSTTDTYRPYRITMLRLNTRHHHQRAALLIFHPKEEVLAVSPEDMKADDVRRSPALQGLLSSAVRCRSDAAMTIGGGGESLFHLTGYTDNELAKLFDHSFLALVCQEDRPTFAAAMEELRQNLSRGELEYRLRGKDGSLRWVLDKCRGYLEADGSVSIYHALTDYTRAKADQRRYEADIERNRAIIEQSNGIVFEWDITSDTMYCSPKWEEHFGYAPVSKNYSSQMGIATHFHPDDLPLLRDIIEQVKTDHGVINIDVRIADVNAKYLWTHISGVVQLNEDGSLSRIVGMLQDVDAMKRAELALREKAEQDTLTQLLNKDTTKRVISDAMSSGKEELSALLVLDLDNFKHINDTYGHLYGDAVLTQVGKTLKRLFREKDVIGRVGGDEFVVYLRNIPSVELLERRCELLLEAFADMMTENAPDLNVSCSIGVALFPNHGDTYGTLFRCADEALYRAKNNGKNIYHIYDPSIENTEVSSRLTTAIDSDRQPNLGDGSFVKFVFRRLYESRDIITTTNELLRYVGQQLNVDRVYIFENNADNTTCSNTFEWCNEGVTSEKENLQNVSYVDDIAGWENIFDERGVFYCTDVADLEPHFRAILEPQGIKSMLQCAIFDGGVFRGYVGFDDCKHNRFWTEDQVEMLHFLAEIIVMFLLKKRTQDQLEGMVKELLALLDRQKAWIYAVNPENFRLLFLNDSAKKLSPDAKRGMLCYKALLRRDTPCEDCPIRHLQHSETGDAIIHNEAMHVLAHVHTTRMEWQGKDACLMTAQDLNDNK